MEKALLGFFAVLFLSSAVSARAHAMETGPARFDSPGSGIDGIILGIKRDSAASGLPGDSAPVRPIIVTVSGLEMGELGMYLEFKHVLAAWKWLFPDKKVDEKFIREKLLEMHRERGDLEEAGAGRGAQRPKKPENYLETDIKDALKRNELDAEVVHFSWSRDPEDTDQVADAFRERLSALDASAHAQGRPLYIIAHSWGSVLMHEAMSRLEAAGGRVEVRRFVTLGSPLVPENTLVWIFREVEKLKERLQRKVEKPRSVGLWVNLWAKLDENSNEVSAADENVRVDLVAVPYQERLTALLKTPKKKLAAKDLSTLNDSNHWHDAYRKGFYASFEALEETVAWEILQDNLSRVLPVGS